MLVPLLIAVVLVWSCGAAIVLALCRTARLGDDLERARTQLPGSPESLPAQRSAVTRGTGSALSALTGRSA